MPMPAMHDSDVVERSSLRILVVSAVRLLREGLVAALESRGVRNVSAATAHELAGALQPTPPDVVIVDVRSHGMIELLRLLATGTPPIPVIAFGVEEREADVLACAEAGASAFLSAECGPDELRAAIASVGSDELVCSPRVAALLFRWHGSRTATANQIHAGVNNSPLTNRESEVLDLLGSGMSNKEIATALYISVATVKHHVHRILEKLHVHGRGAAVAQVRDADRPRAWRDIAALAGLRPRRGQTHRP
jgi:two-component system, NarL family, nitrate/nitrite response regulator NarL